MSEISVLAVEIIHLDEPLTVYDLSIDHDESFLLANGVIAHNSTICLGRNGLRYTLPDHEPINHDIPYLSGPPYHPHCRSVMVIALREGGPIMQESTSAWLRRQGPAMQDEVLGPTRARMFRTGSLTSPRQLLDAATGRPLTLEELGA